MTDPNPPPRVLRFAWEATNVDDVLNHVKSHLGTSVIRGGVAPHACFDIDDTLLVNGAEDMVALNGPGKRIWDLCKDKVVATSCVTARHLSEAGHRYALDQLTALGYRGVGRLHMTLARYHGDHTPARFKRDARARLPGTLVLNVGDQWTDVMGPGDVLMRHGAPGSTHAVNKYGDVQDLAKDRYYGVVGQGTPELLSIKLPAYE